MQSFHWRMAARTALRVLEWLAWGAFFAFAAVVDQISAGSCSTQPERGKCCANSSCPVATGAIRLSSYNFV